MGLTTPAEALHVGVDQLCSRSSLSHDQSSSPSGWLASELRLMYLGLVGSLDCCGFAIVGVASTSATQSELLQGLLCRCAGGSAGVGAQLAVVVVGTLLLILLLLL